MRLFRPAPYYQLNCGIMPYDWGPSGGNALIPSLLKASGLSPTLSGPTAELWMGAHPRLPARLRINHSQTNHSADDSAAHSLRQGSEQRLDLMINRMPQYLLGPALARAGHRKLPFLFKIVEANRPLSIQAHPDRAAARRLHLAAPQRYPDSNHKPELAVSLQGMQALKGFREEQDLLSVWKKVPELQIFCREAPPRSSSSYIFQRWLKQFFSKLVQAKRELVGEATRRRRARIRIEQQRAVGLCPEDQLFLQLAAQFGPEDRGLFCADLLNHATLQPGEALFIEPGEPHAYLQGTILECAASSDNVVRAGLTSKYRDVESILEIMSCRCSKVSIARAFRQGSFHVYQTPAEEFELSQLEIESPDSRAQPAVPMPQLDSPSILLIYSGALELQRHQQGKALEKRLFPQGTVLFLPGALASQQAELHLSAPAGTLVYRCRAPLPIPEPSKNAKNAKNTL